MKKGCCVNKSNRLSFDHPIEKAIFVLSAAFYDQDELSKEDLIKAIKQCLNYIQKWETMQEKNNNWRKK